MREKMEPPRALGRPASHVDERLSMASGTIRYWAAARAAAGTHEEPYEGDTLESVLLDASSVHGPELARVLSMCSFLVDGARLGPDAALPEGAVIEVLPPFAGG
jgi:molybdopterin converting factor small subunit